MKRKQTFSFALLVLFASWSIIGFVAAGPVNAQPATQETVVVPTVEALNTMVASQATPLVPVTGEERTAAPPALLWLFYGFLGMIAVVFLIAFLASLKRTAPARSESPISPPDEQP